MSPDPAACPRGTKHTCPETLRPAQPQTHRQADRGGGALCELVGKGVQLRGQQPGAAAGGTHPERSCPLSRGVRAVGLSPGESGQGPRALLHPQVKSLGQGEGWNQRLDKTQAANHSSSVGRGGAGLGWGTPSSAMHRGAPDQPTRPPLPLPTRSPEGQC